VGVEPPSSRQTPRRSVGRAESLGRWVLGVGYCKQHTLEYRVICAGCGLCDLLHVACQIFLAMTEPLMERLMGPVIELRFLESSRSCCTY
jgi:hypothetical protein